MANFTLTLPGIFGRGKPSPVHFEITTDIESNTGKDCLLLRDERDNQIFWTISRYPALPQWEAFYIRDRGEVYDYLLRQLLDGGVIEKATDVKQTNFGSRFVSAYRLTAHGKTFLQESLTFRFIF